MFANLMLMLNCEISTHKEFNSIVNRIQNPNLTSLYPLTFRLAQTFLVKIPSFKKLNIIQKQAQRVKNIIKV